MKLPIFHVNAFASRAFSGNPAAVCPLRHWLDAELMQRIAAESHITTAFLVGGRGRYELRWFTPANEIEGICGHGTLAAGFVAMTELGDDAEELRFTVAAGELRVRRNEPDVYVLDLPALPPTPYALSDSLKGAFGRVPLEVLGALDLVAVLASEPEVAGYEPDFDLVARLPLRAAIVTAPGEEVDFVSRWFCPKQGEGEDTGFTGSAHCSLVPYWAGRLAKTRLRARQLSPRGATIDCELHRDRVWLRCSAVKYLHGEIHL